MDIPGASRTSSEGPNLFTSRMASPTSSSPSSSSMAMAAPAPSDLIDGAAAMARLQEHQHHHHYHHHHHHEHHHNNVNHLSHESAAVAAAIQATNSSSSSLSSSSSSVLPSSRLVFDKSIVDLDQLNGQQKWNLEATSTTNTSQQQQQLASILESVNFNLVREMIAQHLAELIIVCVIIIYLVYYFSVISRVSNWMTTIRMYRSKFVSFIRSNLHDTLGHRFSPLIYFWGTNPQTALFGYLQGQTSDHEVPRAKFKRQFLHVNDAQYLASNVDLSQHYPCLQQTRTTTKTITPYKLVQLDANQLILKSNNNTSNDHHQQEQRHQKMSLLLDHNIRHALNNIIGSLNGDSGTRRKDNRIEENTTDGDEDITQSTIARREVNKGDGSSAGSSSDSGVFATNSSSNSSSSFSASSSSSGSSLTIDMTTSSSSSSSSPTKSAAAAATSDNNDLNKSCSCPALYDSNLHQYLEPLSVRENITASSASNSSTTNCTVENITYTREQVEFGQCALDWFQDSHRHYHRNKLVALISAGMTTGSDKKYVTDTVLTLDRLGYEVCVFIRRGVGGLKLSSNRFFSPSKWRDFEAAVVSVRNQRPGARLVAIGFSFGSIELCRYLSMSGAHSLINAALLISCPFDPEAGGRNMRKRALNRKIDAYLAKNLGKQLYQALGINNEQSTTTSTTTTTTTTSSSGEMTTKTTTNKSITKQEQQQQQLVQPLSNLNGSIIDLAALPKIKSLVDFEDNYNRVIQNYPNSEAYAADSRLNEHLINIKTPTLCLSSEDDFMAPVKLLPIKQIEANKNLCMVLTKRGGHMAFIDGLVWPKKPYFAQRIIGKYMLAFKRSVLSQEYAANANHVNNMNINNNNNNDEDNIESETERGKQRKKHVCVHIQ